MTLNGTSMGLVLLLLLVVMLWGQTTAQSGCTTALIGFAPCLSFISGNSSTPSSYCCSQLSNVVQTQPRCLCSLLNGGGANLGISINQTRAVSIPGACHVQTPPVSRCNGVANAPAPAPSTAYSPTSNSPSDSFDDIPKAPTATTTPANSAIPSGGSKSIPSNSDASDGTIVRAPTHVLVCALFAVSYASIIIELV